MSIANIGVLLCLLAGVIRRPRGQKTPIAQQMKGLDEQVQEVKSDVLSHRRGAEPAGGEAALSVGYAPRRLRRAREGRGLRLDAVQIQIDGQLVAHYIYSFKELEALQQGRRAAHLHRQRRRPATTRSRSRSTASSQSGKDYNHTEHFAFTQGASSPSWSASRSPGPTPASPRSSSGTGNRWLVRATCCSRSGAGRVARLRRPSSAADLRDLYFGEALFEATQGHFFEALERLDAELAQHRARRRAGARLAALPHQRSAEFSMSATSSSTTACTIAPAARSRRCSKANVDEVVRNEAAFRLARIHFQKDQPEDALHALERIQGKVPEAIRDDVEFLRANVYLALGRPADAVAGAQAAAGCARA